MALEQFPISICIFLARFPSTFSLPHSDQIGDVMVVR